MLPPYFRALAAAILVMTAHLTLPARADERSIAEAAARALMSKVCKDPTMRAATLAKIKQQESEYRVAVDSWDFEVGCQKIDLPSTPVHDTADSSPGATHTGWIYDARWSADGRTIVSASRDGTVRTWDAETGKPRQTFQAVFSLPGIARSATFVGDGSRIAASADMTPVRMFDVASGKALADLPFAPSIADKSLATFAPVLAATSTGLVFAGGYNDDVVAVDSTTNAVRYRLPGHLPNATSVVVSESAGLVATGVVNEAGDAHTARVQIWKLDNGEKVGELSNPVNEWPKLAFSRDGAQLAVVTGGDVKIYSVAEKRVVQTIAAHPRYSAYETAFTVDGKGLITCLMHPILWDIATAKVVRHFGPFDDICHSVDISPDGRFAVTGSMGSDVRIWEIATGAFHRRLGRDVHPPR